MYRLNKQLRRLAPFFVLAMLLMLAGQATVSATTGVGDPRQNAAPDAEDPTAGQEAAPKVKIPAELETALADRDWDAIAEVATDLPFEVQAQLAQVWLQEAGASLVPAREPGAPLTRAEEAAIVEANAAEEAQAEADAARTRALQNVPMDADKLSTPMGGPVDPNRVGAILTVGDSCTHSNLQSAVNAALSGDTIRVQGKTFLGTDATVNISGKSLTIDGGWNSTCTSKTGPDTTFDVNGVADTSFEIFGAASTISINDFVIQGSPGDGDYGGGFEIDGAHNVILTGVIVINNASTFGAGIHMDGGANVTLQGSSKVSLNNATEDGGGIFCNAGGTINVNSGSYVGFSFLFVFEPNIADSDLDNNGDGGGIYADDCDINLGATGFGGVIDNQAWDGGGIYATNNSFVALLNAGTGSVTLNSATDDGGGLFLSGGSDVFMDDGFISFNSAGDDGGGFYVTGTGSTADADSNSACGPTSCAQLNNNSAGGFGGVGYASAGARIDFEAVYATNSTASSLGSAFYLTNDTTVLDLDSVMLTDSALGSNFVIRMFDSLGGPFGTMDGVTLAGVTNTTASDEVFGIDGTSRLDIWASIIWDVGAAGMVDGAGDVTIDCSIIHEAFPGSDNEVADPLFLDPANGDYHISRNSPAVDKCSSNYFVDVDYEARPNNIEGVGSAHPAMGGPSMTATQAPSGGTQAVIIHPEELTTPLAQIVDGAFRYVDYGSYLWVELSQSQVGQMQAASAPFTAVPDAGRIRFDRFDFDPVTEGAPEGGAPLTTAAGEGFYFVQLANPATNIDLDALEASVTLVQYYPHNSYLVWGTQAQLDRVAQRVPSHRWTGGFADDYRLAGPLAAKSGAFGPGEVLKLDAYLVDDGNLPAVGEMLDGWGAQHLATMNRHVMNENMRLVIWQMTLPADRIADLTAVPQLLHVAESPVYDIDDERSNQIIADNHPGGDPVTGYQAWINATGYDGNGVTVAIVDSGVDWDHADLNVVSGTEYGGYSEAGEPGSDGGPDLNGDSRGSGHGTHVAGIVAGDGGTATADTDGFIYGQGVAPGATLHAMDAIAEDSGSTRQQRFEDAASNSDLSNNSWGGTPAGQGYTASASDHDDWSIDATTPGVSPETPFLAVFSAGNSGFAGLTDPKEAKNLLAVGSTDSRRNNTVGGTTGDIDNISGFSSRGPTADGRIKPDVVAPGRNIISTENQDGTTVSCDVPAAGSAIHSYCSGTSMASPHVAGAAALFTERWHIRNNTTSNPHPALVKAAIINTTDDLGGRPDGNEGWGRVNIDRMLNPPVPVLYYQNPDLLQNNGEFWEIEVIPYDLNEPLRVTLVWNDAPGAALANPALVNDLYLRLQDDSGVFWRGNVFAADGWSTTGGANDTLNNVENVWIENPADDSYTVRVQAISLAGDGDYYNGDATDQQFSLVCYNCTVISAGTYDAGADEVYAQVGINGAVCSYATISDAITAATAGDTIYIPSGTYKETLDVDKSLTFLAATNDCTAEDLGANSYTVVVDADDAARSFGGVVQISAAATNVLFRHMYFTDGTASYGGIMYVNSGGGVTLDDVNFGYGEATILGGGLRVWGIATMENDSWIFSCQATGTGQGGGAAIGWSGTLNVESGSDIGFPGFRNSSPGDGGGVYMDGGTLNVRDSSTVRSNDAAGDGGGIWAKTNTSGAASVNFFDTADLGGTNDTLSNTATIGGGLYITGTGSSAYFGPSTSVQRNASSSNGGGIAVDDGASLIIDGASIIENTAGGWGGGIYVRGEDVLSDVDIQNGANIDNNVGDLGGGLYVHRDMVDVNIIDSTLDNNSARWGGGIRINGPSLVDTSNTSISSNSAFAGNGGAVANSQGLFTAVDPDIRFNNATGNGGGIYNTANGTISLSAVNVLSLLAVNGAGNDGGGIWDNSGSAVTIDAINGWQFNLNTNAAGNNGGAVYAASGTDVRPRGLVQINSNSASQNGGAFYLSGATTFIDDWSSDRPDFSANRATNGDGGGIYALNSTSVFLNGVDLGNNIIGNDAQSGSGGGLYADNSNVTFNTTTVENNTAAVDGGGVALVNGSSLFGTVSYGAPTGPEAVLATLCDPATLPADTYCSEFRGNDAGGDGGGLFALDSSVTVEETAFIGNTNRGTGSAIEMLGTSSGSATNLLVAGNDSTAISNSAVHVYINASLDLSYSTFVDNNDLAVLYAAGATGNIEGLVIWDNFARGTVQDPTPTCNTTQDSVFSGGSGNISADPLFTPTTRGNYRLGAGSPAIDACTTGTILNDLDNVGRPKDGDNDAFAYHDMGAFEALTPVPTAITLGDSGIVPEQPFNALFSVVLLTIVTVGWLLVSGRRRRTA